MKQSGFHGACHLKGFLFNVALNHLCLQFQARPKMKGSFLAAPRVSRLVGGWMLPLGCPRNLVDG